LPQYENAVRGAGGEPVRIELDLTPAQVMKQIEHCDGVLLPGSRGPRSAEVWGAADERRSRGTRSATGVDSVLLADA